VVFEVLLVASHHIVIVAVVAALILRCDSDQQTELIKVVLLDHFTAHLRIFNVTQFCARNSHDGLTTRLTKAAQVEAVRVVLELERKLVSRVRLVISATA